MTGVKGVGKGGLFLFNKIKTGGVAVGKGAKFVGGKVATGGKAVVVGAPGSIKMAAKGVANKAGGAAKKIGSGAINVKDAMKMKVLKKRGAAGEWNANLFIDPDILTNTTQSELNTDSLMFIIDIAQIWMGPENALKVLN